MTETFNIIMGLMIVLSIIVIILVLIAKSKYNLDAVPASIFIGFAIAMIIASCVLMNENQEKEKVLGDSSIVYEDFEIYQDDKTGQYFKIKYSDSSGYSRQYLSKKAIEGIEEYKNGSIEKVDGVEVFKDENGDFVIIDASGQKYTAIASS